MQESGVPVDEPGRVERLGLDFVPEQDRHGRPRSLFAVWAGSNVAYLYFVLGGLMVILGLDVVQAVLVVIAGNLLWAGVGLLAISGPASGSPSEVIGRAFYGVTGNRVVQLTLGWLVGVLYEAINLSVGAFAAVALLSRVLPDGALLEVVLVVALAVVTFGISVLGHATIVKLAPWFTWTLLAALVVMAVFVAGHADLGYRPEGGVLTGAPLFAAVAGGFAIIASAPLSWQVGADYARYLPSSASRRATAAWTAVGGFLPATGIAVLGVLAATAVDMTDPQTSMAGILPGWFYVVFLIVIVIGSISNNVLTAYSTGLALLAVGVPWRRSRTVVFDAVVAVAITLYALLIANFLDTLSGLLEITLAVLAPAIGVYAVDIALRRNRYDGLLLRAADRTSPYWFTGGFNLAGCLALLTGSVLAFACLSTTFYVGPVAAALGGADLSVPVGILVAAGIYAAAAARTVRRETDGAGRRVPAVSNA